MRLKKSRASAEEDLIAVLNEGYRLLNEYDEEYAKRKRLDEKEHGYKLNDWGNKTIETLESIFPTELEAHLFLNPPSKGIRYVETTIDRTYQNLRHRLKELLESLTKI